MLLKGRRKLDKHTRRNTFRANLGGNIEMLEGRAMMASFGSGNLALLVAGATTINTTASVVEIDTTTSSQSGVQTISIPGTGTDAYRISGSSTSTGYLALSNDRSLLAFTGANNTNTSSNVNSLNPRGVFTINNSGTIVKQTTYTGISGDQTRGATSLDNSTWYIGDQGGQYTNGATAPSPAGNLRAAKSFGGTVYVQSTNISTSSSATGGTITSLPGSPVSGNDFYLIQSGNNGGTYDILYVLNGTAATAGTISKFSLVDTNGNGTLGDAGDLWTANSSFTTGFGGYGLTAADASSSNNNEILYVSTGNGSTTGNSVLRLVDTAGYNSNIAIQTGTSASITGVSGSQTVGAVTFLASNSFAVGQPVRISGSSKTGFNGTWLVTAATATQFTVALTSSTGTISSSFGSVAAVGTNLYTAASGTTIKGLDFAPVAVPTITVATTASAFTSTYGTASAAQTFSISGSLLTANILATAPTGFEVSSDGTTYGGTASFSSSGGSLRVRLAANAAAGSYNSQNIVLSSTGVTSVNIVTTSSGNTVSPKALTITGVSAQNKDFDNTTTASLTGTAALASGGVVNSDVVTLGGTPSATFADALVGINKAVTVTGYTIGGSGSGNYSLTQPTGLTASIIATVPSVPTNISITPSDQTLTVSFTAPTSTGGVAISSYKYSTDNGATFRTRSSGTGSPIVISTLSSDGVTLLTNGTTYDVKILAVNSVGDGAASATTQGTPVAVPAITVSPTTLSAALTTTYGSVSSAGTFTLSGRSLTGDLTVTAPTGLEISSDGTNYFPTLSVPASGTLSNTTISVRLRATASFGNYNNALISVSGGGATTQTVSTSASGNTVSAKALTITGLTATGKQYDSFTTANVTGTPIYSGLENGDTFAAITVGTWTYVDKNVATNKTVSRTAAYITPSANYTLTQPSLSASITAAPLTVSVSVSNKNYDGTSTATITSRTATPIGSDVVTITGGTASFADALIGNSKTVDVTGLTLGGTDGGNYLVTYPVTATANILASPASTIRTAWTFEGQSTAATTGTGTASTIGGVTGAGTGGIFYAGGSGSTNAYATTTYPAVSANSGTAGYQFTNSTSGLTGDGLSISFDFRQSGSASKYWQLQLSTNGTSFVNASGGTGTVSTGQGGNTETSLTSGGLYTNNSSGTSTFVTGITYTLTGSAASPYLNNPNFAWRFASVFQPSTSSYVGSNTTYGTGGTARIDNVSVQTLTLVPSAITVSATGRAYNGTALTGTATVTGGSAGGTGSTGLITYVYFNGPGGNNGTNTVLPSAPSIVGSFSVVASVAADSIYAAATSAPANFTITQAPLTITNAATSNKSYDGTTAATITGTLSGVVGGETVTLVGTGTFAQTSVGTNLSVTSTSTLTGATASNYSLTQPSGLSANITPKTLTVTGAIATNKIYDGLNAATLSGTLSGVVGTEDVAFAGSGTFAQTGVGTGVAVTSTSTLTGAAAGNYSLTQPSGLTANITPKNLTLTGAAASTKTYDGNNVATITGDLSGVLSGEVSNVTLVRTGTFIQAGVGTNLAVTSTSTLTGAAAGNYSLTQPTGLTAGITPKSLTVSGLTGDNKVYDRNTIATATGTATLEGVVGFDQVSLPSSVTYAFANKNVGTAKPLTISGLSIIGSASGNYTLVQPSLTADITPLAITGDVDVADKVFDGTTTATIVTRILTGVLSGDTVTYVGGTANFASSAVGNNIVVTATGLSLSGADAGNYSVNDSATTTANITPAAAAPTFDVATVNGGDTFLNPAQRSQLTSFVMKFSAPVIVAPGAFTVANVGLITAQSADALAQSQILVTGSGTDTITLRWGAGAGVVSRSGTGARGNSLADGNWQLSITASKVTSVSGGLAITGNTVFGTASTDKFFRMFGDSDGNGQVNSIDTAAFSKAIATYNAAMDFDGNGSVLNSGDDRTNFLGSFTTYSGKRRRTF